MSRLNLGRGSKLLIRKMNVRFWMNSTLAQFFNFKKVGQRVTKHTYNLNSALAL